MYVYPVRSLIRDLNNVGLHEARHEYRRGIHLLRYLLVVFWLYIQLFSLPHHIVLLPPRQPFQDFRLVMEWVAMFLCLLKCHCYL